MSLRRGACVQLQGLLLALTGCPELLGSHAGHSLTLAAAPAPGEIVLAQAAKHELHSRRQGTSSGGVAVRPHQPAPRLYLHPRRAASILRGRDSLLRSRRWRG